MLGGALLRVWMVGAGGAMAPEALSWVETGARAATASPDLPHGRQRPENTPIACYTRATRRWAAPYRIQRRWGRKGRLRSADPPEAMAYLCAVADPIGVSHLGTVGGRSVFGSRPRCIA